MLCAKIASTAKSIIFCTQYDDIKSAILQGLHRALEVRISRIFNEYELVLKAVVNALVVLQKRTHIRSDLLPGFMANCYK
jgi:hypothetical protein